MAFLGNQSATASGNITTQNLVPAGAATAGSAVEIPLLPGHTTLGIQITGTYTGILSIQGTVNGTAWITLGGTPLINVSTGAYSGTIASATQGIFQADVAGFTRARITALVAVTGTASVSLMAVISAAMMSLDAPLPSGANTIGAVTVASTTSLTPGTAATNLGKAEDAAHSSGDVGVMALGVQQATPVALGAAGDYEPFTLAPDGRLQGDVAYGKTTTNGLVHFRSSALTNTAVSVKGSAGNLYGGVLINTHTAACYLKLYNTATVTVGTTTPVLTIPIPAGVTGNPGITFLTGDMIPFPSFSTAIYAALTLNPADNDATVVPALPIIQLFYM